MIPRYSRPEMANIWSEENFFDLCFKIEAYATEAMAQKGQVPEQAAKAVWANGKFTVARIREIEQTTRHEFIAFLTALGESLGENAKYVHKGLTSTDVLDTAFSAQLKSAGDILCQDLSLLMGTLRTKAIKYKDTLCMGRTHGMHAEPTTFGLKLLGFYEEFRRNLERLKRACEEVSVCAISGAVGNFANVDTFVEEYVAEKLGLTPEPVSTQVIPRDRFAMYFATLAVIASSIERLAVEIRHLQRTEVAEANEMFHKGQKGSSAMPHKSNPVLSENLCGLARIIRSYATPALEDVALWHERDISHSSVERIIAPDSTIALDFALNRLNEVVDNLEVHEDKMLANIDLQKGLIYSQRVLLALVDKGLSREEAYKHVQSAAMKVWHGEKESFRTALEGDEKVPSLLTSSEITALLDSSYYTRNIDKVFKRVLG